MVGVQCVICLSSDISTNDWCAMQECGHVLHTHCAVQALEHNKRCPHCRKEYTNRKYNAANPPYTRIFFEWSDEPASQAGPLPADGVLDDGASGGGGGGGSADSARLAFLQGQLREKERRIQTYNTQLVEAEQKLAGVERDLELARSGMREREAKLQEKVGELSRERRQVKALANQLANACGQLKVESARATLCHLSTDTSLCGPALAAEVDKLVRLGLKAPNDFWEKLMSDRSQVIITQGNKHMREKAALERQMAAVQAEAAQLQSEVASLRRSLAAARQQHGSSHAAAAPPAAEPRQHGGAAGSLRHGVRRLGGNAAAMAGGGAAAAGEAAEEEDPLVHSYDLLSMQQAELAGRLLRPAQQQQQQGAGVGGSGGGQAAAAADIDAEEEEEEEDEIVVLDGSEEQEAEQEEVGGGYSEVESEDEATQQQQQRQPGQQQQQRQQQQTAAGPRQQQQQQQQGSVLGKRPAAQPAAPPQQASRLGRPAAADENRAVTNVAGASGSSGLATGLVKQHPLLAAAGPGLATLQNAPGRSFIRNQAAASSVGLDRGRYFSSGPDGKGGVATAYSSGGGAAPVRLSQKRLDVGTMHGTAAGSGRAHGGGVGSQDTAAAMALRRNKALPITSFFERKQQ